MSVEKIKMMNRERALKNRIIALSKEKSDIEEELFEMRHNCKHEIIIRDKEYGFSECIFCGNDGFSNIYLEKNPAVVTVSKLENEWCFNMTMDRIRKKYKQIWVENDGLSEEKMREKLREEFEEKTHE